MDERPYELERAKHICVKRPRCSKSRPSACGLAGRNPRADGHKTSGSFHCEAGKLGAAYCTTMVSIICGCIEQAIRYVPGFANV